MASTAHRIRYKQDMPPSGGYEKILFERTFPKTWATGAKVFGLLGLSMFCGCQMFRVARKRFLRKELENFDARVAMMPFVLAERDRHWLRWIRHTRDNETEVMKDHPGWQTGTWYGEPIYFTLGEKWWDPAWAEVTSHARDIDRINFIRWNDHSEWAGPKWYDKYIPDTVSDYIL